MFLPYVGGDAPSLNLVIIMNAYSRECNSTETMYNITAKEIQNLLAYIIYV